MTKSTRSLIANARRAAAANRALSICLADVMPLVSSELSKLAEALDRDAAEVEAEAAVVIGTDDDGEPDWEIGPLDRKW